MTTLALVVATNQPEIKTWMVRANLIRGGFHNFSKQSVSFHRLSVCLVFPHISPAGSLYGRAVDRQATQSLGQRKRRLVDDRETGRTHRPAPFTQPFCSTPVLTPLLYHLFLPHPPSSSSTCRQIFHPPAKWTRCKSDKCSSRVGRIVLPLLVFPLF